MSNILVAYASKQGTTTAIAELIAKTLKDAGYRVDLKAIVDVLTIDAYDAVVIGSAIRLGAWLPDAVEFIKTHRELLRQRPIAYFTVCMTLAEDTPEHQQEVAAYLDPVRAILPAQVEGFFAGAVFFEQLPFMLKFLIRTTHIPIGDYRNWQAIQTWAAALPKHLKLNLYRAIL